MAGPPAQWTSSASADTTSMVCTVERSAEAEVLTGEFSADR
jgi:hypothetical protein